MEPFACDDDLLVVQVVQGAVHASYRPVGKLNRDVVRAGAAASGVYQPGHDRDRIGLAIEIQEMTVELHEEARLRTERVMLGTHGAARQNQPCALQVGHRVPDIVGRQAGGARDFIGVHHRVGEQAGLAVSDQVLGDGDGPFRPSRETSRNGLHVAGLRTDAGLQAYAMDVRDKLLEVVVGTLPELGRKLRSQEGREA